MEPKENVTHIFNHPLHILIIEDNDDVSDLLRILINRDFSTEQVLVAHTLKEALSIIDRYKIDLMLIDPGLPDSKGQETIRRVMERSPLTPVAVITGAYRSEDEAMAMEEGVRGYYDKVQLIKEWNQLGIIKKLLNDIRSSEN